MVESALHGDMQTLAEMIRALPKGRGNSRQYTDPQAKYNGEAGRIESVRIIPTNHATFGNVGTSSVLGEGIVFGKNAIAMAEARTPELYATVPQGHAGRFKAVSFYGIIRFRLAWEDSSNSGEANLIHVGSA
jgi:hypothetical protein